MIGLEKACRQGPQSSRWGPAVSWRLCRLETAGALWVLCRLTNGAYPLRVKPLFGKSGSGLPKPRPKPSALESARIVFTPPWPPLPRTRAYVRGTLKKSR